MAPENNHKDLLADVLGDAAPADFERTLWQHTLRRVRRRRRSRRLRAGTAAVAVGVVLGFLLLRPDPRTTIVQSSSGNYRVVTTVPLPPAAMVTTQATSSGQVVAIATGTAHTPIVLTTARGAHYRIVGDDELLALAAPRVVALIRLGPGEQRLVFVDAPGEAPDRMTP